MKGGPFNICSWRPAMFSSWLETKLAHPVELQQRDETNSSPQGPPPDNAWNNLINDGSVRTGRWRRLGAEGDVPHLGGRGGGEPEGSQSGREKQDHLITQTTHQRTWKQTLTAHPMPSNWSPQSTPRDHTRYQDSKGKVFTFCGPFSSLKAKLKKALYSGYFIHLGMTWNINATPTLPVPKGCWLGAKKQNTRAQSSAQAKETN